LGKGKGKFWPQKTRLKGGFYFKGKGLGRKGILPNLLEPNFPNREKRGGLGS